MKVGRVADLHNENDSCVQLAHKCRVQHLRLLASDTVRTFDMVLVAKCAHNCCIETNVSLNLYQEFEKLTCFLRVSHVGQCLLASF